MFGDLQRVIYAWRRAAFFVGLAAAA